MARFDANGKRTKAVFIKEVSNGRTRYRREQYNLVQYNTDNESEPKTYIEGLPDPAVRIRDGLTYDEVYDEVLFFDAPPYNTARIGRVGG